MVNNLTEKEQNGKSVKSNHNINMRSKSFVISGSSELWEMLWLQHYYGHFCCCCCCFSKVIIFSYSCALSYCFVQLCCFYKTTKKAMGTEWNVRSSRSGRSNRSQCLLSCFTVSYQNNACDSKNIVFTGSYTTES